MTKKSSNLFAEISGWYGMLAILVAYAFVSFSMISPDGIAFQFLNISGSIGLLVIAYVKKVYQSVILNIIWAIIGVVAILQILF